MRKNNSNWARLKIKGSNTNLIINNCVKNDIELQNVYRPSNQELEITLSDNNLKKFKNLDLENYEVTTLSTSLKQKFIHFLIFRIGLIIGVVASIILMFFMQNRLININIYGLNTIQREEFIDKINEYGIRRFSLMNFDKSDLEKYLADNFDLSFVSIITKGNTLIISAKEELPDINKSYVPITAEYNMIIKEINVFAGTSTKKIGDVVFAGDILVEPYEYISNEKISITPCAEIRGEVYFSASYNFVAEEEVQVRTGNSKIINFGMNIGKYKLLENKTDCPFENYEVEEIDSLITNYFVPMHVRKTIAYELTTETVTKNFEDEKDNIINKIKDEAYSQVPSNLNVISEDIKINSTNYGNIVTIYLKSSVYLKYESK